MRPPVVLLLLFANVLSCSRRVVGVEDCGGGQACVTDSSGRAIITAVYIGCWEDEASFGADKTYFENAAGANLTLALLQAGSTKAPYFAIARVNLVGYMYTFWQLPAGPQSSSKQCNSTCSGDLGFACGCGNSQLYQKSDCGGATGRQWAVYSVPAYLPTVYLGCFDDYQQFGWAATFFGGSDPGYYSTAIAAGLRRRASYVAVARFATDGAPQGYGFAFNETVSVGTRLAGQCSSKLCSGEGTLGKVCGCAVPAGGEGQCGTAKELWAAYALPVGPPGYSDGVPRNWAGSDIVDPTNASASCDSTGLFGSTLAACAALCTASTTCKGFLLRLAAKCCYLKSSFTGSGVLDSDGFTYLKQATGQPLAPALIPGVVPVSVPAGTTAALVPTINASTVTGGNQTLGGGSTLQAPGDQGGSNAGVIAAAVGVPLAVLALLGLVAFLLIWRKRKRAHDASSAGLLKPIDGVVLEVHRGGALRVPYRTLQSATQNFSEAARLGSGGFGDVYRADLANLGLVAVKRSKAGSRQGEAEFLTEVQLLSRLHHTNLVQLLGFCDDQKHRCLVYQFVPNGNLRDHLDGGKLSWAERVDVAFGAARALDYLHTAADPPVIHRDVKSLNILLDQNFQAKVADFGLSRLSEAQDETHVTTMVKGSQGYLDPDYVMTNQLTCGSDVWSFGVVLLELLTGRRASLPPPDHALVPWALHYIESGSVLSIVDPRLGSNYPAGAPEKFAGVAQSCLIRQTALRPTMVDVAAVLKGLVIPLDARDLVSRVYTASPVYVPLPWGSFSTAHTSSSYGSSRQTVAKTPI